MLGKYRRRSFLHRDSNVFSVLYVRSNRVVPRFDLSISGRCTDSVMSNSVAGAGFGWYLVVDSGLPEDRRDDIVDVWVRWRGW